MSRRFALVVALLPALALACLGAALPAPAMLTFELSPYGGYSSSLALLPNGLPAVACDGSPLQYGWFDGGTWHFGGVGSGQCRGASLAILPSGLPAISYVSIATHELRYAQFDGAAWQIATVASNAYELGSRSLVVLPSGNPAVVYLDTAYQVVYAWYDGAGWQQTALGNGGDCRPSMTILPSGAPAIAFDGDNGITFAWLEGGTWQTSEVGVVAYYDLSLAVLPSGQPAIAYTGWDYWEGWCLWFAWFTGEEWYAQWVAPGGAACSLAVGAGGEPAVGHLDPDTYTMYYSWRTGESWQTQTVEENCWLYATGLVALSSGDLLFSYTLDDYHTPLRLAAICGPPVSLYANPTTGNDTWDGLAAEWDGTHGPKATIGPALGLAWYLDEVVLAPGVYTGPGNRDLSYYGRQITVRGTDPNDPENVAATVIDIAASPADRHRAFVFSGGEGPEAALRGVTIRNGCAPLTPDPDYRSSHTPQGGAVFGRTASPTIADCVFQNNEALYGGAINMDAPEGATSDPFITRCTFEANRVTQVDNYYAPGGGAVLCYRAAPTITDCSFIGNVAQNTGGEWICLGGALDLADATATVAHCKFLGNSADPRGAGGAVCVGDWMEPTDYVLADCVFAANYATGVEEYDYYGGGAIAVEWSGTTSLMSCIFSGNSSGLYGGAVSLDGGGLVVQNSTFVGNGAAGGDSHVIYAGYIPPSFANSIIRNGPDWCFPDAAVSYSDVEGGWPGTGNIDADPLFVDADGPDGIPGTADDDLHVQALSPCVNAGDPEYDPGPDAQDMDGEPRLQQCRVDMGADETSSFVDCNGNGIADSCEFELSVLFPLDSNPGWSAPGQWAFGQPTGGGSHNHDPVAGHTGSFVCGYNLNGDYANNISASYLTSTPINCAGVSNVELRFWRWLGVQAGPYDHASVRVSNDGGSWTTIWDNSGQQIADTSWVQQVFDISLVADGRTAVYIRWGMGPTDGSVTYPGWNIDDVELVGTRDCNGNAVLDECESQDDCNNNGKLDVCDLFSGFSTDCNENGVPDECDIASGQASDCNGNGLPDECDVASGFSADCNGNGVPDECDVGGGTSLDCNANGVPDECEPDCNGNGIADGCDIASGYSLDCNANGVPDECETLIDCNGNGVLDECDLMSGFSTDCDANGVPDECETLIDCNGDGVLDACDIAAGISPDCNGNAVPDECDVGGGGSPDCNANGVPDECEPDCNGNGTADECDVLNGTSPDCNGNGVPDECDLAGGSSLDCNSNGVPDECDLAGGSSLDCNSNGAPDECDLVSGFSSDCNGNGVPDECDIANGTSHDLNGNGVPDECDPPCIGDLNCDGFIGFADINPFVGYLSNFASWQDEFPGCDPSHGDINCDGTWGQGSFRDINPFVHMMMQCSYAGGCPCPGPVSCP